MSETQSLTYGERAVGLSLNPSGNGDVDALKRAYAAIIDRLHEFRMGYDLRLTGGTANDTDFEMARLCEYAIYEAQSAQMWAVKAVSLEGLK